MKPALICVALILGAAALSVASAVFAPAALALMIIALAWPMQRALQSRLPRALALLMSLGVIIIVFLGFSWLVIWAFSQVGRLVLSDGARFQTFYEQGTAWLEGHGIAVAGLWSENLGVSWLLRLVQTLSGRLNSAMSFWLVVLVYVVLGLLEVEDFAAKLRRMRNQAVGTALLQGASQTAAKLQRYMLVRTVMSVVTGVLVWILARAIGLPLAEEWGLIAFTLNYIPFIGPLVATIFPTLIAMTRLGSWQGVVAVFACLNLIQFVVGSYLEPRVAGNALSISPALVLFSVFFWSFLWGVFGAFIGVPLTIMILTFCAQNQSSRWVAELLGTPAKS